LAVEYTFKINTMNQLYEFDRFEKGISIFKTDKLFAFSEGLFDPDINSQKILFKKDGMLFAPKDTLPILISGTISNAPVPQLFKKITIDDNFVSCVSVYEKYMYVYCRYNKRWLSNFSYNIKNKSEKTIRYTFSAEHGFEYYLWNARLSIRKS
jgi:hypothetical protein